MAAWTPIPLPPFTNYLTELHVGNTYLFAAPRDTLDAYRGIYRTPLADPGAWEYVAFDGYWIRSIISRGDNDELLLVARNGGVHQVARSTDGGDTWLSVTAGLEVDDVHRIFWDGGDPGVVYAPATGDNQAGEYASVVHYSTDWGDTWGYWEECTGCATSGTLCMDAARPGDVAWATRHDGFFVSNVMKTTNGGAVWEYGGAFTWNFAIDIEASTALDDDCFFTDVKWIFWLRNNGEEVRILPSVFPYWRNFGLEVPWWDAMTLYSFGITTSGSIGVARAPHPFTNPTLFSEGLPETPHGLPPDESLERVHLESHRTVPRLYFSAQGQEMWVRDLDTVVAAPTPPQRPDGLTIERQGDGFRFVADEATTVHVFDLSGRSITRIDLAGRLAAYWPATDKHGRPVPSGVYLIRSSTGQTEKLHVIR